MCRESFQIFCSRQRKLAPYLRGLRSRTAHRCVVAPAGKPADARAIVEQRRWYFSVLCGHRAYFGVSVRLAILKRTPLRNSGASG